MKRAILTTALVLAAGTSCYAGPAEIAAALPNEEAECRYLLRLCEKDPSSAADAANVIRAKHEEMPECFRECRYEGVLALNLEHFK